MIFRDATGTTIDKGDRIAFPLGLGQVAQGVVTETHSGFGLDGTPQSQPVVILNVTIVLPADRNSGLVTGICKLPAPVEASGPRLVED